MFRKGGSANEGIMTGLVDRRGYAKSNAADLFASITPERFSGEADVYTDMASEDMMLLPGTTDQRRTNWLEKFFKYFDPQEQEIRKTTEKILKIPYAEGVEETIPGTPLIKYPQPKVKKKITNGDLPGTNRISQQLLKEKQESLSDRAKKYAEILSPGARKRAIYDSLAAASEAFGQSTGDTKQDIANAISAAAKASGGAKDVLDKANLLALQEEIQTNIAKATYKPNVMESTINFYRSLGMNDSQIAKKIGKDTAHITDYLRASTTEKSGYKNWALGEFGDSENWGGFLPENKKGEVDKDKVKEFMTPGKFYWDQDKRIFVGLVEGKVQQVSPK